MRLVITAEQSWTAAGLGSASLLSGLRAGQSFIQDQPPYSSEGLSSPQCGVINSLGRDVPAQHLLMAVLRRAMEQAGCVPERTGLVVGTSSGDICGLWERWHRSSLGAPHEAGEEPLYPRQGPTAHAVSALQLGGPSTTVSVACASGTAALAVASGWLFDGLCDSVLVAGVDALSLYIHAGFNGLGALAKHDARPFAADRDGLVLGEGAAVVVLETDETAKAPVLAELLGTGLSSDGTHMTAPDREGRGVSAAVERALSDAGVNPVDVDMVSVHGTATVFNDQMEAKALHRSFGGRPLPFHCVKHAIGHTLGAAGAIESSLIVYCLDRGVRPPPVTNVAPDCPLRPSPGTTAPPTLALSTNSAFGGHNAVAVFGRAGFSPSTLRERLPVPTRVAARAELILPPGKVDWASLWGDSPDRFRRMNRYVRAGMCVVNRLFESMDELPGDHCGIVLASEANCRISDTRYHGRLVHRGAAQAPRLEFIYTIPGSPAAEIAIHWGLLGPAMVLVAPIQEAVQAAERMIRWRQAERLIAVGIEAQDNTGPIEAVAALIEVGRGPVLY